MAILLKPTAVNVGSGTQPIPVLDFDGALGEEASAPAPAVVRAVPAAPVVVTPVVVEATPVISAEQIDDILEFELAPESQPAAAARAAAHPFADQRRLAAASNAPAALADPLDMLNLEFEEPKASSGPAARPAPPPSAAAVAAPAAAAPPRGRPHAGPGRARHAAGAAAPRPCTAAAVGAATGPSPGRRARSRAQSRARAGRHAHPDARRAQHRGARSERSGRE